MPASRSESIVVCSCGARWGNAARASLDETLEEAERALLETKVATMVKHWEMRHELTLQDRRFAGVVAKAAERLKRIRDQEEPPST